MSKKRKYKQMANVLDSAGPMSNEWTHVSGDLEGRFDGRNYIDIRGKGDKRSQIFISKKGLQKALSLFPSDSSCECELQEDIDECHRQLTEAGIDHRNMPKLQDRLERIICRLNDTTYRVKHMEGVFDEYEKLLDEAGAPSPKGSILDRIMALASSGSVGSETHVDRPPVRVKVSTPFFDSDETASDASYFGEQVTVLTAITKTELLERMKHAHQFIAQTENDGMGGGVVVILRSKAKSDDDT